MFRFLCTLLLVLSANAEARLSVAPVFGNRMVLQQEIGAPLWGTAKSGEKVTMSIDGIQVSAVADGEGRWHTVLPSLSAGGPHALVISGESGEKLTFQDVLIGEVWVGSGQSNMAGRVSSYAKRDAPLAELLKTAPLHQIRLLQGGATPEWVEADEENCQKFSAILLAFGERLHDELDVPVGLMVGAVGGTPSIAWTPEEAFEASQPCRQSIRRFAETYDLEGATRLFESKLKKWEEAAAAAEEAGEKPKGRRPSPPKAPGELSRGGKIGGLYERYISSMQGYGIRGVLWDQGEAGSGVVGLPYHPAFAALLGGWRARWGNPDLPFLYVQKPSGKGPAIGEDSPMHLAAAPPANLPEKVPTRADAGGRLSFINLITHPAAHLVPVADLGGGIHPPDKWAYGNRAAEIAFGTLYGKESYPASAPRYREHQREGEQLRVHFDHAGGGLQSRGESPSGFAIAGADGVFHWAVATIDGDSVLLSSPAVPEPVHARFACAHDRTWADLFGGNGLPVLAFATDPTR